MPGGPLHDHERDATGAQRVALRLQRQAGNQAVTGLITALQRRVGWKDADTGGDAWNAGAKAVPGTRMNRVPVSGLTEGNQGRYRSGASAELTTERADGRAIVVVPADLKPGRAVDVLLHLHGYAEDAGTRPYAGWRQRKATGTAADNTVRDVALDQIEQQLQAGGDTQLIGVLPQGGDRSQFGADPDAPYQMQMDAYVTEVLGMLATDKVVAAPLTLGRVILSAHSGGSHTIVEAMDRDLHGKGPEDGGTPGKLRELVLFDAINKGSKKRPELSVVTRWIESHLDADLAALTAPKATDRGRTDYLATSLVFRGFFSSGYAGKYKKLQASIDAWFGRHAAELGAFAEPLRAHYQTIPVAEGLAHEEILRGHRRGDTAHEGEGNLAEAVRALDDPAAHRAAAPSGIVPKKKRAAPKKPTAPKEPTAPKTPAAPGKRAAKTAKATSKKRDEPMTPERRQELVDQAVEQATKRGKKKMREVIAKDLAKGGKTPAEWFADIVPDATFLGLPIGPSGGDIPGVHKELLAVLSGAEETLRGRYPGKSPAQLAEQLGVYAVVGLRPPKAATGRTAPSMHCYGMAVDINYAGNPFVGRTDKDTVEAGDQTTAMVKRATLLMHGHATDVRATPHDLRRNQLDDSKEARAARAERAVQVWQTHRSSSDAVRDYLRLTDAQLSTLVSAGGHGHDLDWWRARLAEDRTVAGNAEFHGHTDPSRHGFMDLTRELVELLVRAGLSWGGAYASGKDIMHFDLRTGSVQGRPVL
ncbi:MAG TPA: M15 family metallopeptidase [Rugosimonospora sp.]|nr:M15 family metallopeptidase [Rugosimonospora sp.]